MLVVVVVVMLIVQVVTNVISVISCSRKIQNGCPGVLECKPNVVIMTYCTCICMCVCVYVVYYRASHGRC